MNQPAHTALSSLQAAINQVVRGKEDVVDLALTTLLAGGHLLLEDVPGVGKTTLAHTIAVSLGGSFSRVQCTSDLLPGDITGTILLDRSEEGRQSFRFREGPLFANVVLADEINRTPPRTQSALFEAMAEHQVTVDGHTHPLPSPFLVIATQNPFDHHGTYALPESQLDRFLMRLSMGYPDRQAEREIVRATVPLPRTVLNPERLSTLCGEVEEIKISDALEDYLLDLVRRTRAEPRLLRGVSTRGTKALYQAVKAWALLRGRSYAVPEDVRHLAVPVLAHRVLARERDGEITAIEHLLSTIPSP